MGSCQDPSGLGIPGGMPWIPHTPPADHPSPLPVVEGSSGVCTVMKSQRGQICSRGSCSTPKVAEVSGVMMGS